MNTSSVVSGAFEISHRSRNGGSSSCSLRAARVAQRDKASSAFFSRSRTTSAILRLCVDRLTACFELVFWRAPCRFHPPTLAAARSEGASGPSARNARRSSASPRVANLRSSASSARMSSVAATRVIWSERSSVSSSSESTPAFFGKRRRSGQSAFTKKEEERIRRQSRRRSSTKLKKRDARRFGAKDAVRTSRAFTRSFVSRQGNFSVPRRSHKGVMITRRPSRKARFTKGFTKNKKSRARGREEKTPARW